jgi:hypothetical protein
MAEQPGKQRGDEPRTDLPPTKEPTYEGYFGDEEDAERKAGDSGDTDDAAEDEDLPPARPGKGGGEGEGGF